MTDPGTRRAFVGLGGNLGDPRRQLESALGELAALASTRLVARSSLYRTAPWGVADQPAFVNAVAELESGLAPRELLHALLAIEQRHGRVRDGTRWGPRTLDLDLLACGDVQLAGAGLVLPHPELARRAFVLVPLAEIAPDFFVAGAGRVRDLLAAVDVGEVVRLD
ncbi:MAG: 2-amino-4-hydroxy-6-hydroxymethyldihydropteridine diphosphokinase [Dokdonella sp.]|uniref:2-amino-4-hydroxy-6- hydroxymethyldihydropteridine diphosphokinase n=1 Tax=Dokdonella sp. TaxID=2291710 RepID=UPI003F8236D8